MTVLLNPIGIVHSPFKSRDNAPRQPRKGQGVEGIVEVFPEYEAGLRDLDGFSHLILICYFHLSSTYHLDVTPPGEKSSKGLFATRSPNRPNPLGLSTVRLKKIEGCNLHIMDLDIIDETPLLDIKPYFRSLDERDPVKSGWLEKGKECT